MTQKTQAALGLTLYIVAAGALAGAWSNLADFCLWLATGLGLLMMMPDKPNIVAASLPLGVFLAAPWLAGLWR